MSSSGDAHYVKATRQIFRKKHRLIYWICIQLPLIKMIQN